MISSRDELLKKAVSTERWDMIVIGGGATGLGTALDAASRGYSTLLLEANDFGKGTSSKSTKLIHGGVRYLRQGNVKMVMKALRERGRLLKNAPHIAHPLRFVIPCYKWWHKAWYGLGMKVYDALARRLGIGPSRLLSREKTLEYIPGINATGLLGGVEYWDGQFDDTRLLISIAHTAVQKKAVLLNYIEVLGLIKENGQVKGVRARDSESGEEYTFTGRSIINATGIFTDSIRRLDDPDVNPMMQAAQGIHLVVDASFLSTNTAVMVPDTDDGRVLFGVPWHGKVLIGTTDTPLKEIGINPKPLEEEIEYLLSHIARYLSRPIRPEDVQSVFAGLRPLVRSNKTDTKSISRDHTLVVSPSLLVTITGGKWTTYRQMAEDAVNRAEKVSGMVKRACPTRSIALINSEAFRSEKTADAIPKDALSHQPFHPNLPYVEEDIRHAVTSEWARTVDDVLSRRTRCLFLDASSSIEAAPAVAAIMATELGWDEGRQKEEVARFVQIAQDYLVKH